MRFSIIFQKDNIAVLKYVLIISLFLASSLSGGFIGFIGLSGFETLIVVITVALTCGIILFKPYMGIVIVIITMPIQLILPEIPIGSSILSLIGFTTLAGFLLNHRHNFASISNIHPQFVVALLFVFWITISNPSAALISSRRGIIFLTYIQLLIFMWLVGKLMTRKHQNILMIFYLIISVLVAFIAIVEGELGPTFGESIRAAVLTGNANGLALHFAVNVVISLYLRQEFSYIKWWRLSFPLIFLFLILGIVATLSRLGLTILVVGIILFLLLNNRIMGEKHREIRNLVLLLILIMLILVPWSYWGIIYDSIISAVSPSNNTLLDVRIGGLWPSAIRVWLDHPITGVGVGQFNFFNPSYIDPLYQRAQGAVVHNLFINALVETGLVGFSLFLLLLYSIARSLVRNIKNEINTKNAELGMIWLIILIQIGVFGLAHNVEYHKLLWLTAGMSIALSQEKSRMVN
jgi:O-antigen ligase